MLHFTTTLETSSIVEGLQTNKHNWLPVEVRSWRFPYLVAPPGIVNGLPSGNLLQFANWKMAIKKVDLPIDSMVMFHSFLYVYQRV